MNLTDIIEQFLLDTLGDELTVNFNRNELAVYFAVAPSQINYVLQTRFTPERGYLIESKRGGGGSMKLIKLNENSDDVIFHCIEQTLDDGIEFIKASQMIDRLCNDGVYSATEAELIKAAISDKALIAPTVIKNKLRGAVLKNILLTTLKLKSTQEHVDN